MWNSGVFGFNRGSLMSWHGRGSKLRVGLGGDGRRSKLRVGLGGGGGTS